MIFFESRNSIICLKVRSVSWTLSVLTEIEIFEEQYCKNLILSYVRDKEIKKKSLTKRPVQ